MARVGVEGNLPPKMPLSGPKAALHPLKDLISHEILTRYVFCLSDFQARHNYDMSSQASARSVEGITE